MAKGIRIWRYQAPNSQWLYRNRRGEETVRELDQIGHKGPAPEHGDWLFEEKGRNDQVPETVAEASILAFVKNTRVPADATVWVFKDEDFHRIYHRSTSSANTKTPPAHVQVIADICTNNDLVIDRGDAMSPRRISRNVEEDVELEVADGEVSLENLEAGLTQEQLFAHLAKIFHGDRGKQIERAIYNAGKALNDNDESTFEEAAEFLLEYFAGATPGPVGGTDYIHQINQAVEDTSKVVMACQDSCYATYDASGATGDFGAGVMSVDHTWQAFATVLSISIDIFQIYKLTRDVKAKHPEAKVDLKKLRKGRGASLCTNLMKGYTTIGTSVGTISSVASGGTSVLCAGTAASLPGVGAVAGLATMVRSSWQSEKSRRRGKALKKLQDLPNGAQLDDRVQALLAFGIGKAMRKHKFKAAEATAAAGGMASSTCLAVGAAVAGANAWNPVGWGIGAVCIIAGGGLLSYKIYRKVKSHKRAKKRGFESADYPQLLVNSYVQFWQKDTDSVDTQVLGGMLESYGVNPTWLHLRSATDYQAATELVQAAIARIERHVR